jgi:hypothetical protein
MLTPGLSRIATSQTRQLQPAPSLSIKRASPEQAFPAKAISLTGNEGGLVDLLRNQYIGIDFKWRDATGTNGNGAPDLTKVLNFNPSAVNQDVIKLLEEQIPKAYREGLTSRFGLTPARVKDYLRPAGGTKPAEFSFIDGDKIVSFPAIIAPYPAWVRIERYAGQYQQLTATFDHSTAEGLTFDAVVLSHPVHISPASDAGQVLLRGKGLLGDPGQFYEIVVARTADWSLPAKTPTISFTPKDHQKVIDGAISYYKLCVEGVVALVNQALR